MENIDGFIRQNAAYLTIPDMAEETGLPQHVIRNRCQFLEVTPIKLKDQVKQFVRDHCYSKTPEEIAIKGNYRIVYLQKIYKELGLSWQRQLFRPSSDESAASNSRKRSPRQILGEFRIGYHHYPVEDSVFK